MSYTSLLQDIKAKNFAPVYLLHGEESYYIDLLSEALVEHVLTPDEKEFNQTIFYGKDANLEQISSAVKRYPMMGQYHLVMVKEAQHFKDWDQLIALYEKPVSTTILVIAHKKPIDGRLKWPKVIKKNGEVFKSEKVKTWEMDRWLQAEASAKQVVMDPVASRMLLEAVGADLQRLSNDLDKLKMLQNRGQKVDAELIEKVIGVSKEYNSFEMMDALLAKNVSKAIRIAEHFASNPKDHPIQALIGLFYNNFIQLLIIHSERISDAQQAAKTLGKPPFIAKNLLAASRRYSYGSIIRIIGVLREYDMKSKGVGNRSVSQSGLLKELIFKITH